ncbi:carboxymuconolactone decarboxylase family protein, partial [Saccharothrix hoggarensis]
VPEGAVPESAVAGLSAVATAFHYLNRVVNVFLDPQPLPPPARGLTAARAVLGRVLRPGPDVTPGASLPLLDATGDDVLDAVGRTIDAAAADVVPDRVRGLVARQVAEWDGTSPALGPAWLDGPLAELSEVDRPAGRLALLTAKASYRVTDEDVADVRALGADDRALVTVVSWAAWTAAAALAPRTAREEKTPAVAGGDD